MALIAKIQNNGQVYIYEGTNYVTCCTHGSTGQTLSANIQGEECIVHFRRSNGQESTYIFNARTGNYISSC
jgi:hypothetical protein